MKTLAAWYRRNGEARDVLEVGELEVPAPAAGEVCVRLTTSGVNPSDVKRRAGVNQPPLAYPRAIPNMDGAGRIDRVKPSSRFEGSFT